MLLPPALRGARSDAVSLLETRSIGLDIIVALSNVQVMSMVSRLLVIEGMERTELSWRC